MVERSVDVALPRISLVTPVRNAAHWIEDTLRSIISQAYPNLDLIVVDGGSTDGTVEIIKRYESQLSWWISEPDAGMYDALNKGFARTDGELMGWLSATDMLHTGALWTAASIFTDCPHVEWVTGIPTLFSEQGATISVARPARWSRTRFLMGANRYIQQESTFWRRSLWQRAGDRMDDSRRAANDFELWVRFFRHARLHTALTLLGGYRLHGDSIGLMDMDACHRIHDEIIAAEIARGSVGRLVPMYRKVDQVVSSIPKLRVAWFRIVHALLYRAPGPDLAPYLAYRAGRWSSL